jgi:hypothetical protein
MKRRRSETDELHRNYATAMAKVRLWADRADKARQNGRKADAERCEDKARDWASRARQIERIQEQWSLFRRLSVCGFARQQAGSEDTPGAATFRTVRPLAIKQGGVGSRS